MTDRAQSPLDFLLGAVIFLLAVVVVVTAVPGMLDPFATGTESHPIAADRAATNLATDVLVEAPDSPYLVTQERVDTVLSKDETTLRSMVGLSDTMHLNVTLTNRTGLVASAGPTPSDRRSVTAAWRIVDYQGDPGNVTVRVW